MRTSRRDGACREFRFALKVLHAPRQASLAERGRCGQPDHRKTLGRPLPGAIDSYRAQGVRGVADRSSRPHTGTKRTPRTIERKVLHLRRAGAARLSHLDRTTAEPIRRYEHPTPGDLIHVAIKETRHHPRRWRPPHPRPPPGKTPPQRRTWARLRPGRPRDENLPYRPQTNCEAGWVLFRVGLTPEPTGAVVLPALEQALGGLPRPVHGRDITPLPAPTRGHRRRR
ncbi:hypothetical protein J3R03_006874 [Actinoplanes couchii]|nr:hypothetical protein [Actinoplanes couchii]